MRTTDLIENVPVIESAAALDTSDAGPAARVRARETRANRRRNNWTLEVGAFGVVFGLVRAQSLGWTSPTVLVAMLGGVALLVAFVIAERRASEPMLPMSFFSKRAFAVTNFASLTMYFGMFGSIFFLSQFMQNVLHNTPLQAGLKILVWTGATMVVAPLAGVYSQRFGSRPFMLAGLTLQAGALAVLVFPFRTLLARDADESLAREKTGPAAPTAESAPARALVLGEAT